MLHHRLPGGGAGGVPPSSPGGAAAVLAGRLQQGLSLGEPPRLAAQREAVQALRRSAQVQFSAIVAAQTWLTQVGFYWAFKSVDVVRAICRGQALSAPHKKSGFLCSLSLVEQFRQRTLYTLAPLHTSRWRSCPRPAGRAGA